MIPLPYRTHVHNLCNCSHQRAIKRREMSVIVFTIKYLRHALMHIYNLEPRAQGGPISNQIDKVFSMGIFSHTSGLANTLFLIPPSLPLSP